MEESVIQESPVAFIDIIGTILQIYDHLFRKTYKWKFDSKLWSTKFQC